MMSYHHGLLFIPQKRQDQNIFALIQKSSHHATELGWGCEQTLLYHLSTSKWILSVKKLELFRHIKKIFPLAGSEKINDWYLKMLNIVLNREIIHSTLMFYLASFGGLKQSVFGFVFTNNLSEIFSRDRHHP